MNVFFKLYIYIYVLSEIIFSIIIYSLFKNNPIFNEAIIIKKKIIVFSNVTHSEEYSAKLFFMLPYIKIKNIYIPKPL